jgi:Fe-Mn family superoxide dismutase
MAHSLPSLPYETDGLKPYISRSTLETHHGKHHAGYVRELNGVLEGTDFEDWLLEKLICANQELPEAIRRGVFNCAAEHYNHSFYWNSLRACPERGTANEPDGALAEAINEAWGSYEAFREAFTKEAVGLFGSGWVWLVKDEDYHLSIISTHGAETPITDGLTPILTCDVWEHAYYIDYRNDRGSYLRGFWELANWDFASANF